MPFATDHRTPAELTGVARGAFDAAYEGFSVAGLLPVNENFTLDYNFAVGAAPLPPAARFRSFNTRSMENTVGTGSRAQGKLPPMSIRLYVDEWQQLEMYGQTDAIGRKFEEYAERNAQSIAFRVVLAAAEAIEKGKVTIEERGLAFEVDFGRRDELSPTAAIAWSSLATAKPIDDLEGLRDVFGKRISAWRMSQVTTGKLQRNASLIKMAMKRGTDLPDRISFEDVRTVFRDYNLGEIIVVDEVVNDIEGNEVPLFSPNAVIGTSAGQVGTTEIGVTGEAMATSNGIDASEAPGLFAGAIPTEDPIGFDIYVNSIVLPVLTAPNNTAVLSV